MCITGCSSQILCPVDIDMLNRKFIFAVLSSTIGSGFQHGYHSGVINIPYQVLQDWILVAVSNRTGISSKDISTTLTWSMTIGIFSMGGILGGFLSGFLCQRFGRKGTLLLNNFIALAGIVPLACCKLAASFELFIIGRFLVGVNAGLNSGACQMYLIEIAPVKIRGAVASVYPLVITVSILLSHFSGSLLGNADGWPLIFALAVIPACLQLATLPFCPESPKFLLIDREEEGQATEALAWLRNSPDVSGEMEELKNEDSLVKQFHLVTLKRMFSDACLRTPLYVCLVVMVGQKFSGINAVVYFSTQSFHQVGIKRNAATLATIATGSLGVLMTVGALFLIDYVGRKPLLLVGFMGMAIDTILLTVAFVLGQNGDSRVVEYLCICLVLLFVILFFPGIGTVPWFITAELFHHAARPLAVSLTMPVNWLVNLVVVQAFISLENVIGFYVFLTFAVLDFFFFYFVMLYLPETNQKSAREIIEQYQHEFYE